MSDLTDLSTVSGEELTIPQIRGILSQLDLDILNLARDGKLAALKSSTGGETPEFVDRSANLRALLEARAHNQRLLESRPGWTASTGEVGG